MQFNNFVGTNKKAAVVIVVIVLLVIGNVFFAVNYFLQMQKINALQKELTVQKTNEKVAAFLKLFVVKVLESNSEISFEDRLQLENAIRDIGDPEILAKWEQFTGGTNESQIQDGVKQLLLTLATKIYH